MKITFTAIIFLTIVFFLYANSANAATNENSLHGHEWTFGQSTDRKDQLWKKGVSGATLSKKRTAGNTMQKNTPDTSASIEQALSQAENMRLKGKLGFTLERDSSGWVVAPEQKAARVDEEISRERRHILRAFAGVESGGDFKINIGPELILKDEEHSAESAMSDQPDSALGLGMKFKYDF